MMANTPPGPATDASGQAVVDPTKNVETTIDAAVERLNDLRISEGRRVDEAIAHIKEIVQLEREHGREIRDANNERLKAIREVDVGAVQTAASAAAAQISATAGQVQTTAEAMRAQIEATRLTTQDLITSTFKPLADAIAVLQQAFNQNIGEKAQVVETRAAGTETRAASGETRLNLGAILGAASFVLVLISLYLNSR